MLKMNRIAAAGLGLMSIAITSNVFAGVTDSVGTWEGSGAVFSVDGVQQSTYSVEMVNTAIGEHEVQTQITVSLPDGTQTKTTQTMKDTNQGFSLSSNEGTGGGYCLGEGLCLAYISSSDGHGYATTIVIDDTSTERFLTTELQNGKALNLFRQKYFKIN